VDMEGMVEKSNNTPFTKVIMNYLSTSSSRRLCCVAVNFLLAMKYRLLSLYIPPPGATVR
jgi:hypothetical protein